MAEELGIHPGRCGPGLLRGGRIDKAADGRDAIGGKAYAPGVFLDGRFVRGEVDAVHLVAGYVTMEPLDRKRQTNRILARARVVC
jgi:hypothetical protein